MKTTSITFGWLCLQSVLLLSAAQAQDKFDSSVYHDQANALVQQADDNLQDAQSPKQFQDVAALLEKAVALEPHNPDIQFKLGWLYIDKLHDPNRAYPHLKVAAAGHPNDVNARKMFGLACMQTGRAGRAVGEFRAASALQPNDLWIRAKLARSLASTGHWREAGKMYDEILQIDPHNEEARLGQAELQAWRGETTRPLETLNAIVLEDPGNVDAIVLMGDIHRWNWRLADARTEYEQALAVSPDDTQARNGLRLAEDLASPSLTLKGYQFTDKTGFGRLSAGGDLRIPLGGTVALVGGGDFWQFSNPGFTDAYRADGDGGLDFHWNRWLETTFLGQSFNYLPYHGRQVSFGGAVASANISLTPVDTLYLIGSYNQPFVSSMSTVVEALRQNAVGAGQDFKLVGPLSVQNSLEVASISDNNSWWEEKPQLSFKMFNVPATYLRVQYDYLSYAEGRTNYWTPGNWQVVSPILATSVPLGHSLHIDVSGSAPYVFTEDKFGYEVEGGPTLDLGRRVQLRATGYKSYIPGAQVTWSGYGWQASLRILF